jgi:DNA-binding NarL/FixJ family response regulator
LEAGLSLTAREIALLQDLANGKKTWQISAELNFAENTLRDWMSKILVKLQAKNRTHAVAIAYRLGLID